MRFRLEACAFCARPRQRADGQTSLGQPSRTGRTAYAGIYHVTSRSAEGGTWNPRQSAGRVPASWPGHGWPDTTAP